MDELVEYTTADGASVRVATNPQVNQEGFQPAKRTAAGLKAAAVELDEASGVIAAVAKAIRPSLEELSPKSVEVEFGITLTAEAGVIVAKAAAEASITVTITW